MAAVLDRAVLEVAEMPSSSPLPYSGAQACIANQSQPFLQPFLRALPDRGALLDPRETKMSKTESLFLKSSQSPGKEP